VDGQSRLSACCQVLFQCPVGLARAVRGEEGKAAPYRIAREDIAHGKDSVRHQRDE